MLLNFVFPESATSIKNFYIFFLTMEINLQTEIKFKHMGEKQLRFVKFFFVVFSVDVVFFCLFVLFFNLKLRISVRL